MVRLASPKPEVMRLLSPRGRIHVEQPTQPPSTKPKCQCSFLCGGEGRGWGGVRGDVSSWLRLCSLCLLSLRHVIPSLPFPFSLSLARACMCARACVCVRFILFSVIIICNCIYLHLTAVYSCTFGKGGGAVCIFLV